MATRRSIAPALATIVVRVPQEIFSQVASIAKERGTTPAEMLAAHLTSIVNSHARYAAVQLSALMPLGKYRGVEVETVIRTDPTYVDWLRANVEGFHLSSEAKVLLDELLYDLENYEGADDDD